jgi:hypothetical protein
MDNAVRMLFKASRAEYVKPEREPKNKKRATKATNRRITGALVATQII